MELTVHPDLEKMPIPVLTPDQYKRLKKSIKKEGVLSPVVIDKDKQILSGRHRYQIATELGIDCPVVERNFRTRAQRVDWIKNEVLGQRNLTPAQIKKVIGYAYNAETAEKGAKTRDVAARIAKKHDVSPRTVQRAGQTLKALENVAPILKKLYEEGTLKPRHINALAKMSVTDQTLWGRKIKSGKAKPMDVLKKKPSTNGAVRFNFKAECDSILDRHLKPMVRKFDELKKKPGRNADALNKCIKKFDAFMDDFYQFTRDGRRK